MTSTARRGRRVAAEYWICAAILGVFAVWCDFRAPGSNPWILAIRSAVAGLGCVEFARLATYAWRYDALPKRWRWVTSLPRGFARDPIAFIVLPVGAAVMALSLLAEYV